MALSRSSLMSRASQWFSLRRIGAPLAAASIAAAALAPSIANAGTLAVRDEAALLSAGDRANLQSAVSAYPFDVRVLTTNSFGDRGSFDRYIGSQVASPNMIVIGIAPSIRGTSVHFGTGTRIGSQMWRSVEDAGDPFFRTGQWGSGIGAILGRAQSAVGTGPAAMAPQSGYGYGRTSGMPAGYRMSTTRERSGFPIGTVLCFGLGALVIFGGIALARRARNAAGGAFGGGGYRTPANPGPYGGGPAGYGPNYGGPVYGAPNNGMSPMGAGLAGAAVGGLAGYAIGRAMDDHGHVETHTTTTYDNGGYDNGGGGSPYDAGGSSSGWDGGGGGFDGGGGGFDGGGGGGDW